MAREGLLKLCPDYCYPIILALAEHAVELEIHDKLSCAALVLRAPKASESEESLKIANKIHQSLIKMYLPDIEDAEDNQLKEMQRILNDTPAIIKFAPEMMDAATMADKILNDPNIKTTYVG